MFKVLGYVLSVIGVIGIAAYSVPEVGALLPFLVKLKLNGVFLLVVSIVLVGLGIMFIMKSRGETRMKKGTELPIYKGKEIIGYRRH